MVSRTGITVDVAARALVSALARREMAEERLVSLALPGLSYLRLVSTYSIKDDFMYL